MIDNLDENEVDYFLLLLEKKKKGESLSRKIIDVPPESVKNQEVLDEIARRKKNLGIVI